MHAQYFSETAHNPETNQRPGRLKTAMTSGSELRFHRGRDSSPIYQNVWEHHHRGSVGAKAPAAARFVSPHRTPGTRRSSATEPNGGSNYPHHRSKPTSSLALINNPNGRHSMDVGVACRDGLLQVGPDNNSSLYHHGGGLHHLHQAPPDDSVIMSRIKKSLEQKEEFLRRPVPAAQPSSLQQPAKEFYSRPQKLLPPVWPPSSPPLPPPPPLAPAQPVEPSPRSSSASDACLPPQQQRPHPPVQVSSSVKPKSKQFVTTLGKIHEDGGGRPTTVTAADIDHHLKQTNAHVVSMRAKQFESGKIDDKTDFYKSELARLSSKHNVPNVAVRKMEYEQKFNGDRRSQQQHHQQQEIGGDDSITSCEYYNCRVRAGARPK